MNILYIILKHVVWRFRIYNYFCEIFKFRDFVNTLRNFAKFFRTAVLEPLRSHFAKIAHKISKSKYFSNIQNEPYSLLNSFSDDIWFARVRFTFQKLWGGGGGGQPPQPFILKNCVIKPNLALNIWTQHSVTLHPSTLHPLQMSQG